MRAKFVLTSHLAPESGQRDVHCVRNRDCHGNYIMNWYWLQNSEHLYFDLIFEENEDPISYRNTTIPMKLRYRFLMFAIGIMEGNPGRKFSESSADFGHFLSAKEAKKLLRLAHHQ